MTDFKGKSRILVDGREFVSGRFTGIGRVVEGLVEALLDADVLQRIELAVLDEDSVPQKLKDHRGIRITLLPRSFLGAERRLSNLTKLGVDLFISPYPKLPLFGLRSRVIHTIHDVLDLTHPLYRKRLKTFFDRWRLKRALRSANLTWYDSSWSMTETEKHFGWCGHDPRVRHPGIQETFQPEQRQEDAGIMEAYGLKSGYILALGNGLPHKNLGVILRVANQLKRPIVLAGVSEKNQHYWEARHPGIQARWIRHVEEQHLPALFRGSFCLVQPSLIEGYGYPPLEAMACGKPAIVSSIPVLIETTANFALSAPSNDPLAWMKALEALENPFVYNDRVQKGLKWTATLRGPTAWEPYLEDIQQLLQKEKGF